MAHDESKKTKDTQEKQPEEDQARGLADQELDKVSGGAIQRSGDEDDIDDLEIERQRRR